MTERDGVERIPVAFSTLYLPRRGAVMFERMIVAEPLGRSTVKLSPAL